MVTCSLTLIFSMLDVGAELDQQQLPLGSLTVSKRFGTSMARP
jgi:hypothetical protein